MLSRRSCAVLWPRSLRFYESRPRPTQLSKHILNVDPHPRQIVRRKPAARNPRPQFFHLYFLSLYMIFFHIFPAMSLYFLIYSQHFFLISDCFFVLLSLYFYHF